MAKEHTSNDPFKNALSQLDRAKRVGDISDETLALLSVPEREIRVAIPVHMDNGSTRIFEGYRVQYSSARGPYKGGIRFHPQTDISEVKALALWMALKTAVANIPMGGSKGGITVDPRTLSRGELERLSRGWVRALHRNLGPQVDVPAPDVNTTPEIMAWMLDEYAAITGEKSGATFTGKPINQGGSEGRDKATGLGGFFVFDALRAALSLPERTTVAIQGMGNVGGNAAHIFAEHGHTIIAMSDSRSALHNPAGLDPATVEAFKHEHGTLRGFPGAETIDNAELLTLAADVLVPAALENQITSANAADIRAKVVLELANGPTTPEADDILFAKNIPVVPDVLANSGGVIVSTFEWEQNLSKTHWSEAEVNNKLREILEREAKNICVRATELATDLRRAAFAVALGRIEAAINKAAHVTLGDRRESNPD